MAPKQTYPIRNYEVGQYLLTLRSRARLTQVEMAARLGIHRRSVQKWESGETYPTAENLRALIAVLVAHDGFILGQEQAEAEALWQQVSEAAPQPLPPFDTAWFNQWLPVGQPQVDSPAPAAAATLPPPPEPLDPHSSLPPLIDRQTELAEIARRLKNPDCRLLTLLGPGGIGKTRLALAVAAQQAQNFSDGSAFVPLTAAGTGNQLISAIGTALQPTHMAADQQLYAAAQLLDALHERHLLLVLDDFEPLAESVELIVDILARAPRVSLLITAHTRLNLRSEWLFDVEGLSFPTLDWLNQNPSPAAADLAPYSAVQLFVQRAAQFQPGLTLSASNLAAISRICHHLAGMPLAIELAASAVRYAPISDIEQQIRSNLNALSTTLRDVPPRHRSLQAVFDHAWKLLSEQEQVVLSRLAIFRGGWSEAAAQAICDQITSQSEQQENEAGRWPFLAYTFSPDLLAALVDKSLVRRTHHEASSSDEAGSNAPESRFVLLEPIREYALAHLVERGEAHLLQKAHATYYLSLAEAAAAQWGSPTAEAALEMLEHNHDNLRAVLQWARDGGDQSLGLRLASALTPFWRRYGYLSEGRIWLEELLALDGPSTDPTAMTIHLKAMEGAAWLATHQHDYTYAARRFEQSLALRQALGQTTEPTNLLSNAALEARTKGDYRQAVSLLEDAIAQHQAMGNRDSLSSGGLGLSLFLLGLVCREQGDFARATTLFERCIELHRHLGDREGVAVGLLALSDVARDQGDVVQVRRYADESLMILRELDVQWAMGFTLNNLALAAYLVSDLPQAFNLISESVAMFRAQKAEGSLAEVLITMGQIYQALGNNTLAYQTLTEALQFAWTVGPQLMVTQALETLALVEISQGHPQSAGRLLAAATAMRMRMGTPNRPVDQFAVDYAMGSVRAQLGTDTFAAMQAEAATAPPNQFLRAIPFAAAFSNTPAPSPAEPAQTLAHIDLGLAQEVPALYGRTAELARLSQWAQTDRCRLISLVGIGGIGKSSLAVTFARQAAAYFDVIIFRSLGEAPPLPDLLDQLIHRLSVQQIVAPPHLSEKLGLLVDLLRQSRCLLILDNLETLYQAGTTAGQFLPGYEPYGHLLQRLGQTAHKSCVILTSRERPAELAALESPNSLVRTLQLTGLPEEACRALLADQGLTGTTGDAAALGRRYDGNPLALKLVADPIRVLFSSDIAAFLSEASLFFEGVGQLLFQQIKRASRLEQTLLTWLAISREPVGLDQVMKGLIGGASRAAVLVALHDLWRRNLIERGPANLVFTLQRVVLEYLTEDLIERVTAEIRQGSFDDLRRYPLIQATAREDVRRSQERLIAFPILERLIADGGPTLVERQLGDWLEIGRDRPPLEHGYGPGNIVNLLRLLRGHLRGLNLARLPIRQAYLQGVELQDASLAGTTIQDSVFTETFDVVTAVAISSTGTYLAAASRRGEVLIWTAEGQTLHRVWRAHTDMIWTLAFSPDGDLLASGSWDGRVKVWNVGDATLRWSGRHTSHANSVAFSPDGRLLASGGTDAVIRLWNLQDGTPLQSLPHPHPIPVIAFSPDGRLLASGDMSGQIRLWAIQPAEPAVSGPTLTAHTDWVDGLAFAPDGRTLASASWDSTVKLWDVAAALEADDAQSALRQTLTGHTDRALRLAWSPDGRLLASAGRDQKIWLWDTTQASYQTVLQGHTAGVNGLGFTQDGRRLLTGSEDGTLRLWDIESGACQRIIQGYGTSLYDVDWSPDGTQLVSSGTDYLVTIYGLEGQSPPRILRGHIGVVFGVSWRVDSQQIASSEWDNIIRVWDPPSGNCLRVLHHPEDPGNYFYGVAWSPDGQRLAAGTYRRGVQIFEMNEALQSQPSQPFPVWIRHVAWSPDGAQVAGGGDDGSVYIWDAHDGSLRRQLSGHYSRVTRLAWSPNGRWLASGAIGPDGGEFFVWDPQRGERIHTLEGHTRMVYAVAWGTDENTLISGDGAGKLRWWDVQSKTCRQVQDAHQGTVQSLRRSPDGTRLASCGDDGAIMLWDLHTAEHQQTIRRDRPYERLNISAIQGLTEAQRTALLALGAFES